MRQHLRGVEAGTLLTVTAVESVDEGALGDGEQSPVRPELDLVVLEIVQAAGGDQVGAVFLGPGLEHLGIVLFGIEATVGQQRLIDRAELVDAEVGIADAPDGLVLAVGLGQRELADDALPDEVAVLDATKHLQLAVVEERRVDLLHGEGARQWDVIFVLCFFRLLDEALVVAVVYHGEKPPQRVVDEIAVLRGRFLHLHALQVTELVEGITVEIDLVVGGQDAKLGACLGIEDEEQAIDDGDAVVLHVLLEGIIGLVDSLVSYFMDIVDGLIGQALDGMDDALLQVLGDGEGILGGLFLQAVHQCTLALGGKALPATEQVEQSIIVAVGRNGDFGKQFLQVEDKITATFELLLLKQVDAVAGKHEDVVRTLVGRKIEDFLDGLVDQLRRYGTAFGNRMPVDKAPVVPTVAGRLGIAVRRQGILLFEESLNLAVLPTLYHGLHLHDEQSGLVALLEDMTDGHHTAVIEIKPLAVGLTGVVAKRFEKDCMEIVGMLEDILHRQCLFDDGLLVVEVFLAQAGETLVELLYGTTVITGRAKDVALEVFCEVARIEIVAYVLYEPVH